MSRGSVERVVTHLKTTSERLQRDARLLPALEAGFETLYALAADAPELLISLVAELREQADSAASRAWLALFELRKASNGDRERAHSELEKAIRVAPSYTAFLVGTELVRIVKEEQGPVPAFKRAQQLGLADKLVSLSRLSDVQLDGPMLGIGSRLLLALTSANGAFSVASAIEGAAKRLWRCGSAELLRLELVCADAELARGQYAQALARIENIAADLPLDARAHAACVELHALVALGEGDSKLAETVLERCLKHLELTAAASQADYSALCDRVKWLAATSRSLAAIIEDSPPGGTPPALDEWSTRALLRSEAAARRENRLERRRRALASLLEHTERRLEYPGPIGPDEELRLRLLWCRLVVDLDLTQMFEFCESVLASTVERSRALGAEPLEMLAQDQLALLCARSAGDLTKALIHTNAAAELALKLLARNAPRGDRAANYRRSQLEDLLPVLDRALEIHAQIAARIAALPDFATAPLDPFDAGLFEAQAPQGSWQRLGRRLQTLAEQVQALALDQARAARELKQGDVGLALAQPNADPKPVLADLCARLRKQDAVLQYLVVGRYLLVFAYGQSFFHWCLSAVVDRASEQAIEQLVRELQDWTQGEADRAGEATLAVAHDLLLPPEILTTLRRARASHLRIVPHGALYRLPFGRLRAGGGQLSAAFSMSLHPTGGAAAASAAAVRRNRRRRRTTLAHIVGPEVATRGKGTQAVSPIPCAGRERADIERALGRVAPPARVVSFDGWKSGLAGITSALADHEIAHFLCHGDRGSSLRTSANLLVGSGTEGELSARDVARLNLNECQLVVLQSCWTGWMDHSRSNPVQGLPQAFTDAGVRAVIAPLTQVPVALAPIFSGVFYRALRFLPAERALPKAMALLRSHGATLVQRDAEATVAFAAWGSSFDTLEYRYTGASDVVFGSWLSRVFGRLGFWWFERQLARGR